MLINSKINNVLKSSKIVAVVGASPKPNRDSGKIFEYLLSVGYQAYPVNPLYKDILGKKCYSSLSELSKEVKIDIVDIFRRSEEVEEVINEAIEVGAKTVWMQFGVVNEVAAKKAFDAGLNVVMDRCILVEHQKLK